MSRVVPFTVAALLLASACQSSSTPAASSAPAPSSSASASGAPRDSAAVLRDSAMARVLRSIAGREEQPAESVFRNIKTLKGVPAGRLVRIMNLGYGRSLGVSCGHCHVPGRWASDEKPQKQIARDMVEMVNTINTQQLAKIPNLKGPQPAVNCTTCHRGNVKPALNM